ncbi:SMP-30/gluconolactonase/LRE family protein [Kribbella sp. NPDC051587]|uniref:SMP-30/gluconolactonase/LRE family protein n=1 Tax=Kribbella sp. NPDC051587 TaxID=3364119 RepID=UPI0037BBBAD7
MPISQYVVPGDAVYPEGITLGPAGDFFVGSSADGTIFRGSLTSEIAEVWLPPGACSVALGLAVYDDARLLVCGGKSGELHCFDLQTRELVWQRTVDGYLNDVCVVGDHCFVTDSNQPIVWRFDLRAPMPVPIALPRSSYLNGITARDDVLFVADQGDEVLWRLDPDGTATVIASDFAADGLLVIDDLLIGVCNRGETAATATYFLSALQLTDGPAVPVGEYADPRFATPSTLAFAGDRLLVVNAQFGQRPQPRLPFSVIAMDMPRLWSERRTPR